MHREKVVKWERNARALQCSRYQPHLAEPAQHTTCSNTRLVLLKMGIMMPETCWESIDNKHLTGAPCWFSLSLHKPRHLLTSHAKLWAELYLCLPIMALWEAQGQIYLLFRPCKFEINYVAMGITERLKFCRPSYIIAKCVKMQWDTSSNRHCEVQESIMFFTNIILKCWQVINACLC